MALEETTFQATKKKLRMQWISVASHITSTLEESRKDRKSGIDEKNVALTFYCMAWGNL